MKLEKGEISSSQLMFLVIAFLQGAHLLIAFASGITKHDTWLAVLTAIVLSLPFILIYIALAQRFPGKNLIQINDIIYGHYFGKLISVFYIWYFWLLASLNLRTVGNFVRTYMMPETPMVAILVMFVFICVWAVKGGIEVIARCSFIFVIITAVLVLIVTVLLVKDINVTNFLPVFEVPLNKFIQGTHEIATVPFCQILVFTMIIPYVSNIKQAKRSILLGTMLGGLQLLIIVARDTAVLGITASIMGSPSFQATRLIDIAHILTRLDILVAIVLLITLFLRVSIFFYATVLGIAQLLKMRSYAPLVLPIGIIIISLSILIYDSSVDQMSFTATVWPIYAVPFEILIPTISLIIAAIRGLPKKRGGECN
ncbi:MAG: GerAB/ArcD/ProY family transporter [Ruminiclostridium sp.]